jgi:hypothetical protein
MMRLQQTPTSASARGAAGPKGVPGLLTATHALRSPASSNPFHVAKVRRSMPLVDGTQQLRREERSGVGFQNLTMISGHTCVPAPPTMHRGNQAR